MKTRIIQSRFWDDEFVSDTDLYTSHLYIYILTSQYINISGMFQLPTKKIMMESHLNEKQFQIAKENLERAGKMKFCDGWVYVVNALKNNKYTNSPDNQKAYEKEIQQVPDKVRAYFDSTVESSVDSTPIGVPINNKSEIINNNKGIVKGKRIEDLTEEDFIKIAENYNVPLAFVKSKYDDMLNWAKSSGKVKKDWVATLRNFVKKDSMQIRKEQHGKSKLTVITPDPNWRSR